MAAVRHLETYPQRRDPAGGRHLRLVEAPRAPRVARRRPEVYRRRRAVAGVAVALLVVTGTRTLSSGAAPAGPVAPPAPPVTYLVQPGDSYWSIAASLDRPGDIRATVDELSAANGGGLLQVGDRLLLPG